MPLLLFRREIRTGLLPICLVMSQGQEVQQPIRFPEQEGPPAVKRPGRFLPDQGTAKMSFMTRRLHTRKRSIYA